MYSDTIDSRLTRKKRKKKEKKIRKNMAVFTATLVAYGWALGSGGNPRKATFLTNGLRHYIPPKKSTPLHFEKKVNRDVYVYRGFPGALMSAR